MKLRAPQQLLLERCRFRMRGAGVGGYRPGPCGAAQLPRSHQRRLSLRGPRIPGFEVQGAVRVAVEALRGVTGPQSAERQDEAPDGVGEEDQEGEGADREGGEGGRHPKQNKFWNFMNLLAFFLGQFDHQ